MQDAVGYGHVEKVQRLLSMGAPVNGPAYTVDGEELSMYTLQSACLGGYDELVKMLLERGANPNEPNGVTPGKTPLEFAVSGNYLKIAKMILDGGADVNAYWSGGRSRGVPPIVSAVELENVPMFHLLRERGAILNTEETGGMGLKIAVEVGADSMVELLRKNGVHDKVTTLTRESHGTVD